MSALVAGVATAVFFIAWAGPAGAQDYETQSDRAFLHELEGTDVWAVEWSTYLDVPTHGEWNECDEAGMGIGCVWFVAGQVTTGQPRSDDPSQFLERCGWHIGPIRGFTHGASWHVNHGFYCDGDDVGVTLEWLHEVPMSTWLRFRVERTRSLAGSGYVFSGWRVTVRWRAEERLVTAEQWLYGDRIVRFGLFVEIKEVDGACSTDFQRAGFFAPRYWSELGGPFAFGSADLEYESSCGDTAITAPYGGIDLLVDERGVERPETLELPD